MYIKCIKRRCGLKKNFYCGLAAFSALAFTACFDDSSANAVAQPVALDSSSSVLVGSSSSFVEGLSSSAIVESSSSAVVESSSSAVPGSSSSSFGLSSSDGVSSSSLASSSSSSLSSSSSSSYVKPSAFECRWLLSWNGFDEEDGVRVPIDECVDSSWPKNVVADGVWRIMETDGEDGGKSSIVWPVEFVDGVDSMAAVKDTCYGICGTAALDKGSLTYNPFVSIGFTLARDGSGNPVPVDVSNWGGICIVYTSDIAPALELDLGDSVNKVLDYALPSAVLMKSSVAANIKCIPWSAFEIPSWFKGDDHGWKDDTGAKAAKQLVGVRIRLQDKPQDGGYKFYITTISAYNSGSGLYAAGPADQ